MGRHGKIEKTALLGCAAVTLGGAASAAPWVQAAGESYGRFAASGEEVEGLEAQRYDAYAEYGLTDKWTLTAKAELLNFTEATDFNAEGYRASLRRQLWSRENIVLSAEVGAVYGAAIGGAGGCETAGLETRLGSGASGNWYGKEWFVFAEGAQRAHGDGCTRNRFELGAGQELVDNVYLISQVYIERGTTNARSDKIETGILYRAQNVDWALSFRQETSGAFEEQGIVISLAARF